MLSTIVDAADFMMYEPILVVHTIVDAADFMIVALEIRGLKYNLLCPSNAYQISLS